MATEEEARAAKRRHSPRLLGRPGVSGVGVERDSDGSYFVAIHIDPAVAGVEAELPKELDGCPTKVIRSGPFRKLPGN